MRTKQQTSNYHTPSSPTASSQPKPQLKWLLLIGMLATGALVIPLVLELLTPPVYTGIALDYSQSATPFAAERRQVCKTVSQRQKTGDGSAIVTFADRAEITSHIGFVWNKLELAAQCQQPELKKYGIGKYSGTSLSLPLQELIDLQQRQKHSQDSRPFVGIVFLQEAEAGPNQPKLDFEEIKASIEQINRNNGVVAIIGPTGHLKEQLKAHLKDTKVEVCSFAEINYCVDWSFTEGRKR
ncbi:hypothetical protein [Kamptonema formosum]|uniref:hypothetical protein n=1 Tax=Kamptonema formosum TaxID=331992 RepID=UPI0003671374|nr:hypothetical protein [Oscillatoria sp. PCC 10802]